MGQWDTHSQRCVAGRYARLPRCWPTGVTASPVIIRSNKWGEAFKPLSRLPVQAIQSNMVYQPREVFMVSTSMAARLIDANR
jgi:hypothetical protein